MKFIKEVHNAEGPSPARGKAIIFCIVAIIKNRIIMKLIYRTLLLNKVCVQGSGVAAAHSRIDDELKFAAIRSISNNLVFLTFI